MISDSKLTSSSQVNYYFRLMKIKFQLVQEKMAKDIIKTVTACAKFWEWNEKLLAELDNEFFEPGEPVEVRHAMGLTCWPHLAGNCCAWVTLIPAFSASRVPFMLIILHKHSGFDLIISFRGSQQLSDSFESPPFPLLVI